MYTSTSTVLLFIYFAVVNVSAGIADRRYQKEILNSGGGVPLVPYGYVGYHGVYTPYAYHHQNLYGCRRCLYGGGYRYNGYPQIPYHGHPLIPNSGFIGQSQSSASAAASASANGFFGGGGGGVSQANSAAQSEVATLNLGPLQATYAKSQANANSNVFRK